MIETILKRYYHLNQSQSVELTRRNVASRTKILFAKILRPGEDLQPKLNAVLLGHMRKRNFLQHESKF